MFNRTMIQHTSRLCKGYLTKKESDGAASDDLASTQLRWFVMSWTAEWRISSPQVHMWEAFLMKLVESGWIAAKKPLLKDINKKKRLASGKKHKQWTLHQWQFIQWTSVDSKFEIFGSNHRVFVRRRVGERTISACVVPTVKHGGVMVHPGDTVSDLFRIQLTSMATTAFFSDTPSHLICA